MDGLMRAYPRVFGMAIFSLLSLPVGAGLTSAVPSLAPSDLQETKEVIVNIKTREFQPETISFRSGEKIRLILRNQDVELHAFVPISLFQNATLNLSGNGAPQFGTKGLLRVLLPSQGQTEILFIPQRPGIYPFFCDLPGHNMKGRVVVHE